MQTPSLQAQKIGKFYRYITIIVENNKNIDVIRLSAHVVGMLIKYTLQAFIFCRVCCIFLMKFKDIW